MSVFDPRISDRIRGKTWDGIRKEVIDLCARVLEVSSNASAELTTIYAKFSISATPNASVYAVLWLKTSKNVVIGFSLPDGHCDEHLIPAPTGMKYRGLTKYFRLVEGESLPNAIDDWAKAAFENVSRSVNSDSVTAPGPGI